MLEYDKRKVAERIRTLRESRSWSQAQMAERLNSVIGYGSGLRKMVLDGDTGRYTVSQLENARRSLTIDLALVYSQIFNASLDYIFCVIDEWQPGMKEINKTIGLSNKAIAELEKYNNCKKSPNAYSHTYGEYFESADYSNYTNALTLLLENEEETSVLANIVQLLSSVDENYVLINKGRHYEKALSSTNMDTFFQSGVQEGLRKLKEILKGDLRKSMPHSE